MRVRGRSDDGQVVRWGSGECQVNVRWTSNLNLSLTLVDVKLVHTLFGLWVDHSKSLIHGDLTCVSNLDIKQSPRYYLSGMRCLVAWLSTASEQSLKTFSDTFTIWISVGSTSNWQLITAAFSIMTFRFQLFISTDKLGLCPKQLTEGPAASALCCQPWSSMWSPPSWNCHLSAVFW